MPREDTSALLKSASDGISKYLADARRAGRIDEQSYQQAMQNTLPNLKGWLADEHLPAISPGLRGGLCDAIAKAEWEKLVNAFRERARFGTGGIRGMMAFDRPSIERLKQEGIAAPILRGPNTINDAVLLLTSAGVAMFGRDQKPPFDKMVIGYDSRIRGFDFAAVVAQLFLAYGYTVYFFDEPVPYPEMTFAIPYKGIKADLGILISASHNDYRYNGYKLSCSNGSQFDPEERNTMYDRYIAHATTADIRLCSFQDAPKDKLVFLGGDEPVEGFNYYGRERQVLNIHKEHGNHVKTFLLTKDLAGEQRGATNPLRIAYRAFHGAGRRAVPRLLKEVGFPTENVKRITEGGLDNLDGLFPSFRSDPGHEQQPDPGDPRAARTAVEAFKKQVAEEGTVPAFASAKTGLSPLPRAGTWGYEDMDILVGTDPDADRCGVVVKVPADQRQLYGGQDWVLLPADSVWALLLWYRLNREIQEHGHVLEPEKKFVVLSHTTSDSIVLLARKHGIGVVKTWVGFAALAAAVRDVWEHRPLPHLIEGRESLQSPLCHPFVCESLDMDNGKRSINIAAMEQSNGYSILGGPPPDRRSLGVGGHVRDQGRYTGRAADGGSRGLGQATGHDALRTDRPIRLPRSGRRAVRELLRARPHRRRVSGHRGRPQEDGNPPPRLGLFPIRLDRRPRNCRPQGHVGRHLSHGQVRQDLQADLCLPVSRRGRPFLFRRRAKPPDGSPLRHGQFAAVPHPASHARFGKQPDREEARVVRCGEGHGRPLARDTQAPRSS